MSTSPSPHTPPAAANEMSEMDVATPPKHPSATHSSAPKKNREQWPPMAHAPADILPKTPSTETKKIYRTSLVVGPRARAGHATLEDCCDDIKRKLLGCAAIHEKMRNLS